MLSHLYIRHYTIIEELDLDFSGGLTVITGETGAGKSIVLDALGLVAGNRADSGLVRMGEDKAEIQAEFDISNLPQVDQWLLNNDLDDDGQCVLRRIITKEGRSRGYINGRPSSASHLKDVGGMLVDIHGQHEHQTLLKKDTHRELLDEYGQNGKLLGDVRKTFLQWRKDRKELDELEQATADREARLAWLERELGELEQIAPQPDEVDQLHNEHKRLSNAGDLVEGCHTVMTALYEDDDSVQTRLGQLQRDIDGYAATDDALVSVSELLQNAMIQCEEATEGLRHYLDGLSTDPQRLNDVENRLSELHDTARKHRIEAEHLPEFVESLRNEFDSLDNAEANLEELAVRVEKLEADYQSQTAKLSAKRKKAAKTLAAEITDIIQQLGMPNGQLSVDMQTLEKYQAHGTDDIEFLVTANPGQPLKSIRKVASGGELSRISLAIQVIAANSLHVPCRVFDEVDTGIGGGVAEIVGQKLQALGKQTQVICITHLPQVAAHGMRHLHVQKSTDGKTTASQLVELNQQQRLEEVARMLGGIEMTEQTLAHAEEMLVRNAY